MIAATSRPLLASYRLHGTTLMGYKRSPLFKILIISTSLSLKARFISILTLTYVVLQPHMDSTVNKTENNILLPVFPKPVIIRRPTAVRFPSNGTVSVSHLILTSSLHRNTFIYRKKINTFMWHHRQTAHISLQLKILIKAYLRNHMK